MVFLTLLVGLGSHLSDVSHGLTEKLGMYFYITTDTSNPDQTNTRVLTLMKELEDRNVTTQYVSQDQAETFLAKRLPDIVAKFKEYNINSTLPATLFVTIKSDHDYEVLQEVIPRYADMISNSTEFVSQNTIKSQEQRVIKALDFSHFLQGSSIVLIFIFSLMMMGVVLLVLLLKLRQFHAIIELKKLLGADFQAIRKPFLLFVASLLAGWFILSFVVVSLIGIGSLWADQSLIYFSQLLGVSGMQAGIIGLLFNGYLTVLAIVFAISILILLVASSVVEHKIRTAH